MHLSPLAAKFFATDFMFPLFHLLTSKTKKAASGENSRMPPCVFIRQELKVRGKKILRKAGAIPKMGIAMLVRNQAADRIAPFRKRRNGYLRRCDIRHILPAMMGTTIDQPRSGARLQPRAQALGRGVTPERAKETWRKPAEMSWCT
jgi:hypothetical protein